MAWYEPPIRRSSKVKTMKNLSGSVWSRWVRAWPPQARQRSGAAAARASCKRTPVTSHTQRRVSIASDPYIRLYTV
eukprot:6188323-Pleurochrysis_carterae.AAC.3